MDTVRCGNRLLDIREYDPNKKYGVLQCRFCGAEVCFVNSYEKSSGMSNVFVQKHFRLKAGEKHKQGCKYTVDGAIAHIYAACADEDLVSKKGDKYVIRLLSIPKETVSKKEYRDTKDGSRCEKKQLKYIARGKKTAYLSTIKQIMQLRALVESNSELDAKTFLQYYKLNGSPCLVSWDFFYFDLETENAGKRLLQYLIDRSVYHPLCVVLTMRKISEYDHGSFRINSEVVNIEKHKRLSITLYFDSRRIYDRYRSNVGCKMMTFAKFKFYKKNEWTAPDKEKYEYFDISAFVNDERQIMISGDEQ